jgi:transcriptional regulator with XRE-family HTH domain
MIKLNIPRLQEYLKFRRWTWADLARKINYSEGYFSQIKNNGINCGAEFIEALIEETKLNFEDLFVIIPTRRHNKDRYKKFFEKKF